MDSFDFCLKGERTYVHGSDIYNAICKYLGAKYGAIESLDLSFHKTMVHNLVGEVLETDMADFPAPPAVICRFTAAGVPKILYLVESEVPVDCRYPYDEEGLVRNGQVDLDGKTITLLNETPYTSIEVSIALNKRLMQTIFAAERGKWWFTRLVLNRPLPESSARTFALTLKRNLGTRLTCSTVAVEGEVYGEMYFSMVKG